MLIYTDPYSKNTDNNLQEGVLCLLWARLQSLSSIHDGNRHETNRVVPDWDRKRK